MWVSPAVCEGYVWNCQGKSPRGTLLKSRLPKKTQSLSDWPADWGHKPLGHTRFSGWVQLSDQIAQYRKKPKPSRLQLDDYCMACPSLHKRQKKNTTPCDAFIFLCAGQTEHQGLLQSWAIQEGSFLLLQVDRELFWNLIQWLSCPEEDFEMLILSGFENDCHKVTVIPIWSKAAPCISKQAGNVEPGQGKQPQCR